MTPATASFPMTGEQARQAQADYAQESGLPLADRLDLGAGVSLELVLVPPGEFLMGTREDNPTHGPHQGSQHKVTFKKAFYLGRYHVTQAQWTAVMGDNPAFFPGYPDHPMETVSWEAIQVFCQRATALTGRVVRLPSEAEWEYACRAGTETTYYFGNDAGLLDEYGWFRGNSGMVSQPVGQFPPNAWGLHDLHGGIDEFAQDNWHETHADAPADGRGRVTGGDASLRALRGGSWYDLAEHCESAHRNYYAYDIPSEDHGLRVLVEIE